LQRLRLRPLRCPDGAERQKAKLSVVRIAAQSLEVGPLRVREFLIDIPHGDDKIRIDFEQLFRRLAAFGRLLVIEVEMNLAQSNERIDVPWLSNVPRFDHGLIDRASQQPRNGERAFAEKRFETLLVDAVVLTDRPGRWASTCKE